MSNDVKVSVRNLTKCFGDLKVLDNISFDIKKGEFICVVGPTGCGKTTFLNLLTRLIPQTSGEILIDGEPADPKKHNISFVFQEAFGFFLADDTGEYRIWPADQKDAGGIHQAAE